MALDLSTDYKTVDFPEAVTLTSVANSGNSTLAVTHAFPRALTYKEQHASSGTVALVSNAYDIPMTLATGYAWKPGDSITDSAGNVLRVWKVDKDPTTAFYSFLVYDPKIAFDLRHTIDVYTKEMTKDASGAAYSNGETLLYSDIACRVQWAGERGGMLAGRTGDEKTATIYCDERLYIDHNCIVKWTDPAINTPYVFDLEEWVMADRIDELMQIRAKVKP